MNDLDIIIPVYNEGENILDVLEAFKKEVRTSIRALIVYDFDEDNTLPVARKAKDTGFEVRFIKNKSKGVHNAIMTGFEEVTAPATIVFPADEAYNAGIVDTMYEKFKEGNEMVVASRFIKGGSMTGGPFFKSILVRLASFILKQFAGFSVSDATYGLRLTSKKVLDSIEIESTAGWTYAIELLVKCHRLRWKVVEVPAAWVRREKGKSRFNLKKWLPLYARWFFYALATSYLRKGQETVKLKSGVRI
ncbi:hypothetical protein A3A21_01415 [Candidatus Jorgensenbacteria bacterium RIFCSPLOWO2_01_FULL_45_25b]|uniref:Glycosyltransferase 2-like domain-containing protein n=1 Tax=Candidatus Jorgensenbacteria bacterium RIFCSPLOWO2_01_FULL_45_25b TaxID=1798471 RepID=A0A1F6BVF4_9BACT|nr:MAG: hypothetical protein A3A21_01415 [Candidatus Jorgensenbacteria bacterium RIFCSPLOWO2_01_FULL_45_25b]